MCMAKKSNSQLYARLVVIFIGAVMILSSIGFIYVGDNAQKYNEAGLKFVFDQTTGYLRTNLDQGTLEVNFLPSQVSDIPLPAELMALLRNAVEIDITSPIDDPLASSIALSQYEFSRHLTQKNVFVRTGFIDITKVPEQHQITCAQATNEVPVLLYTYGSETKVSPQGNCFTLTAASHDEFLRIKDKLLYTVYDIGN